VVRGGFELDSEQLPYLERGAVVEAVEARLSPRDGSYRVRFTRARCTLPLAAAACIRCHARCARRRWPWD
jgi:hypothetical protein